MNADPAQKLVYSFEDHSLDDVRAFIYEKLLAAIRADPVFQRLMAEEDDRIIALIEQTPTHVIPRVEAQLDNFIIFGDSESQK